MREIVARANEPWCSLALDGVELATLRMGGIALLVGGTSRGKTSLAANLLVEHAKHYGPALIATFELPDDEWTARAIGLSTDTSWPDVLCGRVPPERMTESLPERLFVIDRAEASLGSLRHAVDEIVSRFPAEPVLVALDYVQILGLDGHDDTRANIGRVMRDLDDLARVKRVAILALSQGSRLASRELAAGKRLGAQTIDAGAESADLERWASLTLALGAVIDHVGDDEIVQLSIGKSRMGRGDRVVSARFVGRSGRWTLAGDFSTAPAARAHHASGRRSARLRELEETILSALAASDRPMTRRELRDAVGARDEFVRECVDRLLSAATMPLIEVGPPLRGAYRLWLRNNATAAGLAIRESPQLIPAHPSATQDEHQPSIGALHPPPL